MDKILKTPVREWMTKKVFSVKESENIKEVFKLLDKNGIMGVPVVNEHNYVVGIITETDLMKHFTTIEAPRSINLLGGIIYLDDIDEFNQNLKNHCSEQVKDLMTTDVITAKDNHTLFEIINMMSNEKISRMPVVNQKNELIGMITKSDIVHQLAKMKIV